MPSPRITPLARSRIGAAANVLARAFFDDPLTTFTLPDEQRRIVALPRLMRAAVTNGLDSGTVHATRGDTRGVALWLPPDDHDGSAYNPNGELIRARIARALGADGWERMQFVRQILGDHLDADISRPVWHLTLLGVDPDYQGGGVGTELIAPILTRADGEGLACYLETFKVTNLAFYGKRGFEVLAEGAIPGGGPPYWTMLRNPAL